MGDQIWQGDQFWLPKLVQGSTSLLYAHAQRTDVAWMNHRCHSATPTSFYLEPFVQSHGILQDHIY